MASTTVTAAGSPSGIAPTARATAAINISSGFSPRQSPMASVTAARPTMSQSRSLAECSDLARQRRLEAHRLGDQPGNSAGFGLVAGGPNDAFALTNGRQRAGKSKVAPVSQDSLQRKRVAMFVDGDRLTGERGLVDLQVAHGCQTQVCRHAVTRFDQHDVAGDESLATEFVGAVRPGARWSRSKSAVRGPRWRAPPCSPGYSR